MNEQETNIKGWILEHGGKAKPAALAEGVAAAFTLVHERMLWVKKTAADYEVQQEKEQRAALDKQRSELQTQHQAALEEQRAHLEAEHQAALEAELKTLHCKTIDNVSRSIRLTNKLILAIVMCFRTTNKCICIIFTGN